MSKLLLTTDAQTLQCSMDKDLTAKIKERAFLLADDNGDLSSLTLIESAMFIGASIVLEMEAERLRAEYHRRLDNSTRTPLEL